MGDTMTEIEIQTQLLEELKKFNENFSTNKIRSAMSPKPNFAQLLIGEISSLNKAMVALIATISNKKF
jgi:hypothetical protein